tara:strand:- start:5113 stop:6291 length:1179 start_codon:yes stop_codon:yes gene_type:complete
MIKVPKTTIINYYYLFVVITYFIAIYLPFIRIGLSMSLFMIIGIYLLYSRNYYKLNNSLDVLVTLYIIYNIISFVFFAFSDLPVSVFIKEFSNSIFPILLFYFFGKISSNNSFLNVTLISLVGCFIVGFYLQLTLPSSYAIHMNKIDAVGGTGRVNFISHYRSFLGLTATGSLSAVCVLLSFDKTFKSKFRLGKIFLLVSIIALILTFRRAGLFTGIFAFLWINYSVLFKLKLSKFKFILFEFILLFLGFWVFYKYNPEFFNSLLLRLNTFNSAINERSGNWTDGIAMTQNLLTGDGLGRYSHKAVEYSDKFISDGNYFRMIAEIGILGFLIFTLIIITSLFKGYTNFKEKYIELGIIVIICMQAVGSNVFAFQLIAPIFWYSIGRCSILKK